MQKRRLKDKKGRGEELAKGGKSPSRKTYRDDILLTGIGGRLNGKERGNPLVGKIFRPKKLGS